MRRAADFATSCGYAHPSVAARPRILGHPFRFIPCAGPAGDSGTSDSPPPPQPVMAVPVRVFLCLERTHSYVVRLDTTPSATPSARPAQTPAARPPVRSGFPARAPGWGQRGTGRHDPASATSRATASAAARCCSASTYSALGWNSAGRHPGNTETPAGEWSQ